MLKRTSVSKSRVHAPSSDFIALGSKGARGPSSTLGSDAESKQLLKPSASAVGDRKRDFQSTSGNFSGPTPSKRPRLIPLSEQVKSRLQNIEVNISQLTEEVVKAEEEEDFDRVNGILAWALRQLKKGSKPDNNLVLGLLYLSKIKPGVFQVESILEVLCSLLKPIALAGTVPGAKVKNNITVPILACNILMYVFLEEEQWPAQLVEAWIEDALGERIWVDSPACKKFVENLLMAFSTRTAKQSSGGGSTAAKTEPQSEAAGSQAVSETQEKPAGPEVPDKSTVKEEDTFIQNEEIPVFQRYEILSDEIQSFVVELLHHEFSPQQMMDGASRNLIRVLIDTCGYSEVRHLALQRLEMWLQNPKLSRYSQDLLRSICLNCNGQSTEDIEIISQLIKIRVKTKLLNTHYVSCIRDLLSEHPANLSTLMRSVIYNELSNSRNPNNMALIATAFHLFPEDSSKFFAVVFQELLLSKEDYLRAVRALFREVVRQLRYDINFSTFCRGLMADPPQSFFIDAEPHTKERYLSSIADLIAFSGILSVTPSVKEAYLNRNKTEKDAEVLAKFRGQVSIIQRDAVWWLHSVVPNLYKMEKKEFLQCIQKVLFLDSADSYYTKDNWTLEGDRQMLVKLSSEVPLQEDTLMRILLMGLSHDLPLGAPDVLDLADKLVRRAAIYSLEDPSGLRVERLQVMDAVLNLCAYHHPENITFPMEYEPPVMAISHLYWKGWIILTIISAFNPQHIGYKAWEDYPMLRCFMEMVITNNNTYPPPTMLEEDKRIEDFTNRELQIRELEKHEILEFENHLAAGVQITESNSHLLSQLISMNPTGVPRKPPRQVLEQLDLLNSQLKLGKLLCGSRSPDFLMNIIERQGSSGSREWLSEFMKTSEDSLDILPIQCLCEFLLHDDIVEADLDPEEEFEIKRGPAKQENTEFQKKLLQQLHDVATNPEEANSEKAANLLNYFMQRLSSLKSHTRMSAAKALSLVMKSEEKAAGQQEAKKWTSKVNTSWLQFLPKLSYFNTIKVQVCHSLRKVCHVETDPVAISNYIWFLAEHCTTDVLQDMSDLALDLAQLIIERPILLGHILPRKKRDEDKDVTHCSFLKIFNTYLKEIMQTKDEVPWLDIQDQVFIRWPSGEAATMHILVVHAMVILLTYGKPRGESEYENLLDVWFPRNSPPPSAYLVDTSEEALLLPDWLKLHMIRSDIPRLVQAALKDIDPAELVLFVQSFGIPVGSMSSLLQSLDECIEKNPALFEQVPMDISYMSLLVQVQQMRGAQGGHRFHQL